MRIIGGTFGGRVFTPTKSKKWPTRPTTDQAKEALFNILTNRLDFNEVRMLDLFGGLGNHSLEAISRGCLNVVYVEKHFGCIAFVKRSIDELKLNDKINIVNQDVFKYLKRSPVDTFDYIFADPPYALSTLEDLPKVIFENNVLSKDGLLVIEHDKRVEFTSHPYFAELRKYGISHFSFFNHAK